MTTEGAVPNTSRRTMRFLALIPFATLLVCAAQSRGTEVPPPAAQIEFFESKIRPVLANECYKCHSAGAEKPKAKLHLDTREGILKGGESDLPAVVPGKLDDGTLLRAIRQEDEGLSMPPAPKKKLPPNVIADFEAWVKMGAPMPEAKPPAAVAATTHPTAMTLAEGRKFWSFVPPREESIPQNAGPTEVDRFIVAKLEEKKLALSALADKRTRIRRATYDLIGLPPSVKDVEAFVADASPDAFAKVVDRLLASPQYGERWGRYWLDVARYADTKGYLFEEERRYAFSYTYRDWVVRALNEDLPYDQFLVRQIAADRLEQTKTDKRSLAALGFLTLGRRFLNVQADIIDDRIDVVCRGTMALTVACARCHDHKYDPIPTADYYSLYGVFASSREPAEPPLLGTEAPAQVAEFQKELEKRQAELETFTKTRQGELSVEIRTAKAIARYLLAAQKNVEPPHPIGEEFEIPDDAKGLNQWMTRRWEAYLKAAAAKKDEVFEVWRRVASSKQDMPTLVKELSRTPTLNPFIVRIVLGNSQAPKSISEVAERYGAALAAFDRAEQYDDPALEAIRQSLRADDSPVNVALADAEHLFGNVDRMKRRGLKAKIDEHIATHPGSPQRAMAMEDVEQPVTPHVFVRGNAANVGKEVPRQFPAILSPDDRKPFTQGSGRLELARAIASKDNPLTARVMVNRAWQYHFGVGLVRTPGDFGTRGEKPTHPELLDWLALRFVNEDGWSLKKLHRRIMLSAAYQQGSVDRPDARQVDPENKLLWRQNPRRLDFEATRDSLLAASGAIDLAMGGRPVDILAQPFSGRRTIYAFIDRQNLPGMFRTFDFASPDATSARRFNTSVPQQALFMMNSPFVVEQAKKVAARAEVAAANDPPVRVAAMYRSVLGREPAKEETELAVKFIAAEQNQPADAPPAKSNAWAYGWGEFDSASAKLASFTPLPRFVDGKQWQGSADKLPDEKLGWAMLTADGGHAGNDAKHAVIRRWTAPRDCTVALAGKLSHNAKQGDGVRGRLVSSREGLLASWIVRDKSAETRVAGISLKQGDTIDFMVDCGRSGDYAFDSFSWRVTVTKEAAKPQAAAAGDDSGSTWDSAAEFAGPPPAVPKPLTPWEKYAQVLLESNEFAFVD